MRTDQGVRLFVRALGALVSLAAPIFAQHSTEPMYHAPRWSPDGKQILVVEMSGRAARLLVIDAQTRRMTPVPTPGRSPMYADWTPSGRILFTEMTSDGPGRTVVVDRDGGNPRAMQRDSIASAARDSSLLLFERQPDGGVIFATDRARRRTVQLTRGFWAEQPSLSPDERTIVFERRMNPNDMAGSEIVLMDRDGRNLRSVAQGTDPSWSPDGSTILFKSFDRDGELWVTLLDLATGRQRRLTKGVHMQWSPDGNRIVYMVDGHPGGSAVYVMARDGTHRVCLTCTH